MNRKDTSKYKYTAQNLLLKVYSKRQNTHADLFISEFLVDMERVANIEYKAQLASCFVFI